MRKAATQRMDKSSSLVIDPPDGGCRVSSFSKKSKNPPDWACRMCFFLSKKKNPPEGVLPPKSDPQMVASE